MKVQSIKEIVIEIKKTLPKGTSDIDIWNMSIQIQRNQILMVAFNAEIGNSTPFDVHRPYLECLFNINGY